MDNFIDQNNAVRGSSLASNEIQWTNAGGIKDFMLDHEDALVLNKKMITMSNQGMVAYQGDGQCIFVNQAAAQIFGASPSQIHANNFRDLAMWNKTGMVDLAEKTLATGQDQRGDFLFNNLAGRGIWVDTLFTSVSNNGRPYLLIFINDITERKQCEAAAHISLERAEKLAHAAVRINEQLDQESVLQILCDEVIGILNVPAAAILLENGPRQVVSCRQGFCLPAEFGSRVQPLIISMLNGYARSEAVITAQNVQNQNQQFIPGLRTAAVAAIRHQRQRIGAFSVFSFEEERCFDQSEMTILGNLASLAAQAVARIRLIDDMQNYRNGHETLHDIDLAITSITNLDLALDVILRKVVGQLAVDAARILLADPESKVLKFARGYHLPIHPLPQAGYYIRGGPASQALLEHRSIHIRELSETEAIQLGIPTGIERFASYYNTPLIVKGQEIGVLEVFNRCPLGADSTWWKFFEALATQTAIAIDNITLFEDLQKSNAELALAYDATFEGWSRALDLRDKETEGHTQRVIEMTDRLARAMGMREAELDNVRRGALLHDIGKMAIPDSILLKPGQLDAEEWAIMKRHPIYANDLLSPIAYLQPALDIPYCHHEKWDGSGYPRGLHGEEIPLAARLFAVVDVWDALTSDRPYRPAWPRQQAAEYIRSQANQHFDPHVVALFLEKIITP